jgi:protein translocase SecG subunit
LLQKGKGVGFAGAFGLGGGGDTVFGPRASRSLPQKLTYVFAATFMVLALFMSIISGKLGRGVAPEKVEESAVAPVSTDLDELGIGTGKAGVAMDAKPQTESDQPAMADQAETTETVEPEDEAEAPALIEDVPAPVEPGVEEKAAEPEHEAM